jgi:hypothetical protein
VGLQIQLVGGSLQAGPAFASDGSSFPAASTPIPLALYPANGKQYTVGTGGQLYTVNSPSAFVAVQGVGASGPVTQAHTVYARTTSAMILQVTYAGDATQYLIYLQGTIVLEADPNHAITSINVKGAGQLEFMAVGNQ